MVAPFSSILWLLLFTVYHLYLGDYKKILIVWGFYFFIWYFVFTLCLIGFEGKIVLGHEEDTFKLLLYVNNMPDTFIFRQLCVETVFIYHLMADYFGVVIYVPSLFRG